MAKCNKVVVWQFLSSTRQCEGSPRCEKNANCSVTKDLVRSYYCLSHARVAAEKALFDE